MLTLTDRIRGGIYGALVADALGVPVEFIDRSERDFDPVTGIRGHGTWDQPPGTWSDDGSLLLCSVEALLNGYRPEVLAHGFVRWFGEAHWSARGTVFDIGNATRTAISRLSKGCVPEQAGGQAADDNGNGSLMRILPVALRFAGRPLDEVAEIATRASRLTHAHPRSCLACSIYCVFASRLLAGETPIEARKQTADFIQTWVGTPVSELIHFNRALSPDLEFIPREEIASSGYVVHTLEAALWCLLNSRDYRGTVLAAVNLGSDTDTTGCVAGGLAGILYGINSIPPEWRASLPRQEELDQLSGEFTARVRDAQSL